jgi:hypothetical protein
VGDPKCVQTRFPLFELCPIRATKRDVVKPWAQLIERLCTRWGGLQVYAERRVAKEPYDVVVGAGVFVNHRIGAEQSLIPGPAAIEIGYRHGYMRKRGKLSHHAPNSSGTYATGSAIAALEYLHFRRRAVTGCLGMVAELLCHPAGAATDAKLPHGMADRLRNRLGGRGV